MLCVGVPAQAQDLNARISRLENEIQTLSRAVFRGESPPPVAYAPGEAAGISRSANIEVRLQQMEMELRGLTGRIEEQNYESQRAQQRLEESLAALERRLAALEVSQGTQQPRAGGGGLYNSDQLAGAGLAQPYEGRAGDLEYAPEDAAPFASETGEEAGDKKMGIAPSMGQLGVLRQPAGNEQQSENSYAGPPSQIDNDPAGLYERAFSFLRDRNYEAAESGFSDFLNRYPGHDLAPNAKYWLGETHYVRNNFERAARIFAEAYQQYPDGPKGPDNLLKLGMSLAGLGKSADACITFSQLQKDYQTGAAPVLMRAEKEMEKLGCQQF